MPCPAEAVIGAASLRFSQTDYIFHDAAQAAPSGEAIWAEIFKFTKEIPENKQVEELMDPPLSSVSPHQELLLPVESVCINRYTECW
ncbi:hypothetical protein EK904_015016 [Melospiza melodia maxima]|nr:hypothetical protein EK904_015016 [Melospiza melodia maxima]